jgi:hypothetical protein
MSDEEEDDSPLINLSAEEKQQIREPWCQTLIISHGEESWVQVFLLKRL